jgi:hypothetical protein
MKNKLNKTKAVIFLFMISVFCFTGYSQNKPGVNLQAETFYSASNGDVSAPMLTTVPQAPNTNSQLEELNRRLQLARTNGNSIEAQQLESAINQLTGSFSTEFVNDPAVTGMEQTVQYFNENGDGITYVDGGGFWAIATQTSNRSNRIYAAVTEYVSSAGDRMKLFVSYNNGVTWVLKGLYDGFVSGVRFRNEELDIEPVISGADTMVYAVAGYSYNSGTYTLIARFNVGTGAVYTQGYTLGTGTSINYNPRVTSDNTMYTGQTYVYITVSNDTTITSSNHTVRTRLCVIANPFAASFTQTHRNPSSGRGFWWTQTSAPANSYSYQDVGYFRNGPDNTDVIYVASIFRGTNANNYVFTAWTKDYGVSNAGNLILTETNPVSRVRLAFNGAINQNGAMVYLKDYTSNPAGDVDVRVQNTNNGGFFTNSWVSSFAEYTSDTASSCDIQAVKLANNNFKFAYTVKGGKCFYTSNTSQTTFSPRQLVNNFPAGEGYGRVRAGYRITASDSCLSVWSGNTGGGLYSTYGCDDYTGITSNGNNVPADFTLSQNYPNPFNPVTNIKFSIPQASFVKLVVYDVTGKEVATLVNTNMNAGSFTVDFNASSLASGVYFYRIDTEGFSDVKKMMLIK